jgi:signal transduction histidine kinase
MNPQKEIEIFFLRSLLRICIAATLIVTITDFLFQENFIQYDGIIDFILLGSVVLSFGLFRFGRYDGSVLVITSVTLVSMLYQSITLRHATTMSFSVILVVGFIFSILLKGTLKAIMHGLALLGMLAVFSWQSLHADFYNQPNPGEVITMGFTYFSLYIILSYSAGYLKTRYDAMHQELIDKNSELSEKSNEIETQNEELTQSQQNLYELNLNLEKLVNERSEKIKQQNEQLIKYSYNNAHYLRGPVARVLGLIQVSKLEQSLDYAMLFQKIEEQTYEIDAVVKKINEELGWENFR